MRIVSELVASTISTELAAMSSAIALVFLLFQLLLAVASAVPDSSCLTKCGDVDIPYPFGVGINCSWGIRFNLTCDEVETGVKKPFLFNVEVHSISLLMGQLRFLNPISSACYNTNYNNVTYTSWWINFEDTPYRFSDLHNKFTAIGCDTLAYIIGSHESNISYQSGCVSMCEDEESIVSDSCSGMGCCQTSIPKNLKFYEVSFDEYFNNSAIWRFSRCSYAVLLDAEWFEFQTSYITTTQLMQINSGGRVPVVIDWAIGNETCEVAKLNLTSYACISNSSDCVESSNGPGYLCNCSKGYQGNPYVSDGCQDINECNLQPNPCSDGICQNLPGNYSCDCPEGKHGDAYNGTCIPNQKLSLAVKAVIDDCATLCCFLDTHENIAEPKEKQYPEVLFMSSKDPPRSLSQYPTRLSA
ncbi:hypothetical protein ZIOFF_072401 [Zingiber officinale]|uniref:EGF-like domain-containing protein n=1 Tax=Zingiber officinale TaxID=94328 RepID=A0A8J5C6I4_ZINOF|nr:hypothetical protein ZIOFF_072401 [Zingiber officinale]